MSQWGSGPMNETRAGGPPGATAGGGPAWPESGPWQSHCALEKLEGPVLSTALIPGASRSLTLALPENQSAKGTLVSNALPLF